MLFRGFVNTKTLNYTNHCEHFRDKKEQHNLVLQLM